MPKPDYVACEDCRLDPICSPVSVGEHAYDFTGKLVNRRHFYKRGDVVFRQNEKAELVYAISAGSLKLTSRIKGSERIIDFRFPGELVDICSLNNLEYPFSARALEDLYLCEIKKESLNDIASQIPAVQGRLMKVVTRELMIVQQSSMLLRGNINSEEKIAAFVINLAFRFKACGYSATHFSLSMTRSEISDYLGLAKGTVIRMLQKFHQDQIISIQGKQLTILDLNALQSLVGFELLDSEVNATGSGTD